MNKKTEFVIYHPGEPGAGIHSFTDIVTIEVESGDPGGEAGEFTKHMTEALVEWFDGAHITVK